jgi:hypothetical protein
MLPYMILVYRSKAEVQAGSIYVTKSLVFDTTFTCDLGHETVSSTRPGKLFPQVQLPGTDTI